MVGGKMNVPRRVTGRVFGILGKFSSAGFSRLVDEVKRSCVVFLPFMLDDTHEKFMLFLSFS